MQEKIRKFIEEFHMIEEGDTVLAAVSGGADSLCLLLLLHDLCAEMKFGLCVVHVEHGIRGEESLKDAVFVEKICGEMHIPCKVCRCRALEYAGQHKLTVEEAARKLRYQLFDETAKEFGANKIAVAHNQNDCAETMLFHLARGSGSWGCVEYVPCAGRLFVRFCALPAGRLRNILPGKGGTSALTGRMRNFNIPETKFAVRYFLCLCKSIQMPLRI